MQGRERRLRIKINHKNAMSRQGEMLSEMGSRRSLPDPPLKFTTAITCNFSLPFLCGTYLLSRLIDRSYQDST